MVLAYMTARVFSGVLMVTLHGLMVLPPAVVLFASLLVLLDERGVDLLVLNHVQELGDGGVAIRRLGFPFLAWVRS